MACKKFHIGVFFDGTGNNKAYDTTKAEGGLSNISKLSELYPNSDGELTYNGEPLYSAMIYKNGVGTYDSVEEHKDNPLQRKYDKGAGGGGALRINEAIDEVILLLKKYKYGNNENDFTMRVIDVFGFSRGAAMARDFINTFYKFKYRDYKNVKFNFVGLYDTVGSFGLAGNNINMKPKNPERYSEADSRTTHFFNGDFGIGEHDGDHKRREVFTFYGSRKLAEEKEEDMIDDGWDTRIHYRAKDSSYTVVCKKKEKDLFEEYNFNLDAIQANKIVHFQAQNEVRKNFPLSDTSGAGDSYVFLGVHSDVGGGYSKQENENHSYTISINDKKGLEEAKKDLWRVRGIYSPGKFPILLAYKISKQRVIKNDLSKVSLRVMHELASKEDVPFLALETNSDYELPSSMQEYYDSLQKNLMSSYLYKDTSDGKDIYKNYVHHSAVDVADMHTNYDGNTGLFNDIWKNDSPDSTGGNDARYLKNNKVFDPREDSDYLKTELVVKREIYENNLSKAIKPLKA